MKSLNVLCVSVLVTGLTGCGGSSSHPRAQMSGKVTVNGKAPLPGGSIQFVLASDSKVLGGGQINPDGTYMVPDAPVGDCKVVIDNQHLRTGGKVTGPVLPGKTLTAPPVDSKKLSTPPKGLETVIADSTPGVPKYMKIDSTFYSDGTTPLTYSVTREGGSKDFDVK